MNGQGVGIGTKEGSMPSFVQNVTVSGDTLSVVLDVIGNTSKVELWGMAVEYTTFGDTTSEWWGDWAPNSKLPFTPDTGGSNDSNTTGGNTTGGNNTSGETKTPGFEVIPMIAAVAIAAILLRRRR